MSFKPNPNFAAELVAKIRETIPEQVRVLDAMTPTFVQAHSRFNNFEDMFGQSPIANTSEEGAPAAFASDAWDTFVRETTDFEGWKAMLKTAIQAYIQRRRAT